LLALIGSGPGAAADAPFALRAENDRLSLDAEDAPLEEVLEEIVKQVGVEIIIHGEIQRVVSVEFSDIPLEEGLKRLIRDFDHVFVYAATEGGGVSVQELIIYAGEGVGRYEASTPGPITPQKRRSPLKLKGTSLESLASALEDEDPEVREEAVDLLADSEDERAVLYLSEVLLNDEDEDVRESAAMALEDLGDQRAIGALIRALRDPEAGVRESAVDALAEIGGEEVVGPLMDTLGDEDEDVRETAADALEELTGKDFGL
jgi:hypothetical protein